MPLIKEPSPSAQPNLSPVSSMRTPSDPARLHARLIKTASADRSAYNRLLSLYPPSSSLLLFFHLPFPPTPISFTTTLSSLSSSPSSPSLLLVHWARRRVSPSPISDGSLSSLFKHLPFPSVPLLHSLAFKLSLSSLPFSGSALVRSYSKSGLPSDALKAFDEISQKDAVCYAAAVVGLAQNRRPSDALSVFVSMRAAGVESTMYAVSGALRAAATLAALEQSRAVHAHSVVGGLEANLVVATALVDAYGKAGVVSDARKVFDGLLGDANLVTWNAILAAHAQQGDLEAAVELFDEMLKRGVMPDELTFLAILTACSNAGEAGAAERWVKLMESQYKVTPGLEHYTCFVGAMARVGRLEDAKSITQTMPFEPDAAVWRTLLTGCVVHHRVDMAAVMAQQLLQLDPQDDSAYVMLSNVYSTAGKKDMVAELWTTMRDRGVKKEGGRSWIEVRGKVHVFVAGERRHERLVEIYAKLKELMEEIANLGYKEEDEGLWYHSERLAVAFGVVGGAVELRVVKNLRICSDCHEFFKHVSTVIEKEIVVRDVNRYHRFQQGSCNCRDFW